MPVTLQTISEKRTKDGKNVATPRSLEVTLRFDVTGGSGAMTAGKLSAILNEIVDSSRTAVECRRLEVTSVSGDWAWVYGPWFKGTIS